MVAPETESAPTRGSVSDLIIRWGIAWIHPHERVTILGAEPLVIGRGEGVDIVLESPLVSRLHARLRPSRLGPVIVDEGSKNGVRLNGEPVIDAVISPQDVLRIGDWVGVYCQLDPSSAPSDPIVSRLGERLYGSFALKRAHELLVHVAPTDVPVVLVGETGTGKELFAAELHAHSARPGALVAVNCSALPQQLAEAELFGFKKGAFSGAEHSRAGHFREAHEGTLFLDEVVDLEPALQPKLLRAIEERAVVPLGQSTPVPARARIVSAAQRPVSEAVERGAFRPDLYARLNGMVVRLPPLRERREEVVFHFRRAFGEGQVSKWDVTPDVVEQLCLYPWPGNLREVVQTARRARALPRMGEGDALGLDKLPEHIATFEVSARASSTIRPQPDLPDPVTSDSPRDDLARRLAEELGRVGGNISRAALTLGISRSMAYRLLRRVPGMEPEELRLRRFTVKRPPRKDE